MSLQFQIATVCTTRSSSVGNFISLVESNGQGLVGVLDFRPKPGLHTTAQKPKRVHLRPAFKHHQNSTRRLPREGRMNENCGATGKKERNFGRSGGEGPAEGGPAGRVRRRGVRGGEARERARKFATVHENLVASKKNTLVTTQKNGASDNCHRPK